MAEAKIDAFLDLTMNGDPVKGESSDESFKGTIDLLDCDLKFTTENKQSRVVSPPPTQSTSGLSGSTPSPTAAGQSAYESKVFELSIKKHVDIATPYLYMLYCKRKVKPLPVLQATISVRKTGGGPRVFYTLELADMTVTEYELKWESVYLIEDVTFSAKACYIQYFPQLADGTPSSARQTATWTFFETESDED